MGVTIICLVALLTACNPSPPGDAKVLEYFHLHEHLLDELIKLGVDHPALRRVEPALKKFHLYHGSPTSADLAAEERVYEVLAAMKTDYVAYSREGTSRGGDLLAVEVPVYRWGLSLGGYGTILKFIPEFATRPPSSDKKTTYRRIGDTGWYIEKSDSR